MKIHAALTPYMYTKLVYTIRVTALTNVPLSVINAGKKPMLRPPKAKSSTDLVEVMRPNKIPIRVNPISTPQRSVELIIAMVYLKTI